MGSTNYQVDGVTSGKGHDIGARNYSSTLLLEQVPEFVDDLEGPSTEGQVGRCVLLARATGRSVEQYGTITSLQ